MSSYHLEGLKGRNIHFFDGLLLKCLGIRAFDRIFFTLPKCELIHTWADEHMHKERFDRMVRRQLDHS
jgi:hypothetical protein